MDRLKFGLLIATLLLGAALIYVGQTGLEATRAQNQPATLRGLIDDLSGRGVRMRFEFVEPLAPGERFRDVSGVNIQVGDDFVCFVEPWNDDLRYRCTPFHNITAVTFVE